jgi:hypothetical protein
MPDQADRNKIVTPYTDPDRWTEKEKTLFDQGKCSWQTGFGLYPGHMEWCGQPSKPGTSFGHCAQHDKEMLETCYPDGSPRWRSTRPS